METSDIAALQSEKDPARLLPAALRLAESNSATALDAIARSLADEAFLMRLDDVKA